MATHNYSRSEWASLSIQERIRAMNHVAGDEVSLHQEKSQEEEEEQERPELPKRSSVVDIWRKREATSPVTEKPKKQPNEAVSVPWPDEEDNKLKVAESPSRTPQKAQLSWRNLFKGRPAAEDKEADLTILPAKSNDDDAEVASVASHSKSVMDAWTKRELVLPDSPVTVKEEPLLDAETTPKRSSVVDIWSKRTVLTKSKPSPPPRPPPPPPKDAFLSPLTPTLKRVEEEPDMPVVQEKPPQGEKLSPWRILFKGRSGTTVEGKEADLTILPAKSNDGDAEVAAASHSKSIVDIWTKKEPVIPDSPMTVEPVPLPDAQITPKQSSVVDIWSKRTVPTNSTAPPPKEAFADLVVVKEEPSIVVKRPYKPAVGEAAPKLQNVPKQVVNSPGEEEPEKSSVVNRWQPFSPVVDNPTENGPSKSSIVNQWQPFSPVVDNHADEEPEKSNVMNRWQPFPPVVDKPAEEMPSKLSVVNRWQPFPPVVDNPAKEEPATSSVVNRWQPQGGSPQAVKVPTKASPIVSQPAEDMPSKSSVVNRWQPFPPVVDNPAKEEPSKSSVVNRWQPQGGSPRVPKVPTKGPPTVSQPSVKDADDAAESGAKEPKQFHSVTNRWQPHGHGATPPLRKVPTKTSPVVSPYGNVQLRKVPTKASPPVVSQPSVELADNAVEPVSEEPNRSSVASRWQPQGVGSSTQLRKDSKPVATMSEVNGEAVESIAEPTKVSVVDRYKLQASESVKQLRRKVPKPIITDPEGVEETTSDNPKSSSVLDRYKPQVGGTDPVAWRRKALSRASDTEDKTESVEESKPQGGAVIPQLRKVPKPVTEVVNETAESREEQKRSSVLDRYKPQTKGSKVVDRYKPQGSETPPAAHLQKAPTKELSPVKSSVEPDSENTTNLVEEPKRSSVLHHHKPPGYVTAPLGLQRKMPDKNRPPVVVQTMVGPAEESTDAAVPGAVNRADKVEEGEWALPTINSTGSLPFDETPANVKKVLASVSTIQVVPSESFESAEERNLAVIKTPVAIPAVTSRDKSAESSFMAKGEISLGRNGSTPFQSGTSAFRAKVVGSGLDSSSNKPISRSRPLRSMKEFLNQHTIKGSQESSENPDTTVTTDESMSTKDSSLTGGTPYRIGAVPVSSPPPVEGFQVLEEEDESKVCTPLLAENDMLIAPTDTYTDTVLAAVVDDKPTFPTDADTDRISDANDNKPIAHSDADTDTTEPSTPSTDDDNKAIAPVDVDADKVLAFAGEKEKPDDESEPGRITSSKAMNSQEEQPRSSKAMNSAEEQPRSTKATISQEDQYNNPSRRASRKRLLLERRTGRTTPTLSDQGSRCSPDGVALGSNTSDESASTLGQDNPKGNGYHPSRPAQYTPSNGLPNEDKAQQAVPIQQKGESRDLARSRWSNRYNRARDSPVKPYSLTPVASCDSDTLTFVSGTSSGYSAAISGISFGSSVTSATSSLTNRACQKVMRRRRNKLTKAEEKLAAQDLARRVISQTIKEQPRPGVEEDEYSGADQACETPRHEEFFSDFSEPTKVPENEKGVGLAGRYNTSSRFMESVQNMMHGVGLGGNTSFESETTEGSSQFRSVESTSDSEGWMSGRMRKSSSSVHHRVPSDSTDGELDYDGLSWRRSDVVADNFVSASASNLEALKSAYKAVSLHQIAMDLTEEVSTATNLNLQKIASDLNDGMSAASESIRSSLGSPPRSPRKLKVPKSSSERHSVDEEVAIEVEYVEDSDEEGDANDDDIKPTGEVDNGRFENGISSAGEPSQESLLDASVRRRAYV